MNIETDYIDILTGFSDFTRLRILFLLQNSRISVNCIVDSLELPQSTVSRHLCNLRKSGMIESENHGTTKLYRLAGEGKNHKVVKEITAKYYQNWKDREPFISDMKRLMSRGKTCSAGCRVAHV